MTSLIYHSTEYGFTSGASITKISRLSESNYIILFPKFFLDTVPPVISYN